MVILSAHLNSVFNLKPKYHQYNNLLSSLSLVLIVDISKKVELNLRQSELELTIGWSSLFIKTFRDYKQKIDYDEFAAKINYNLDESGNNSDNSEIIDWDDTKSYSSISITKEYELINESEAENTSSRDQVSDYYVDSDRQFSMSSDELASDSSSPNIDRPNVQKNKHRFKANPQNEATNSGRSQMKKGLNFKVKFNNNFNQYLSHF